MELSAREKNKAVEGKTIKIVNRTIVVTKIKEMAGNRSMSYWVFKSRKLKQRAYLLRKKKINLQRKKNIYKNCCKTWFNGILQA